MASPCRINAATRSGNKENNLSQDRRHVLDCPTPCEGKGGATSKKRKTKPSGGFNLRKSIAWNPAFFTEQGVLDNTELSMLSGSQVKPTRSPASGCSSTFSPLSRFRKSGNTSVLKEVGENSHGKFPAKCLSTENKGRKLFASSIASGQDERKATVGSQDKRSAKSIQKSIPRPPPGYAQKKVPNSSAAAQIPRIPKKSQPSLPVVSGTRSTSSVTKVPKPTTKPATVKSKHIHKVEGPLLKSKTEKPSVTKSSRPTIGKDMVPALTATCEETNSSGKYRTSSPVSQDNPSSSVVVPSPISAKPSALRMPSPSVGFFTQGKASVSHSDSAQRNPERCFSGNIPSLVKPPRYKQPVDLKSRFHLTKQLPTNVSAASNLHAQSDTNDSTTKVSASSFPGLLDANDCSVKQSLSKSIIPFSAKSGNTNNQEMPDDDFFLAGNGATTQQLSSIDNNDARNDMPNECNVVMSVGQGTIEDIKPIEDTHNLNAICGASTEPAEDLKVICSSSEPTVGRTLIISCISLPGCTPNDLNCQSKSDNGEAAVDRGKSLSGGASCTVCSSEGNNYTPATDSFLESCSCYQQNMLVQSIHCTDQMPQRDSSRDIKPSLAYSKLDSNDSLCSEVQLTSTEGPNFDSEMELDTDDESTVKEAPLLHLGGECDYDYRSAECLPMNLTAPSPCVDQEARAANLTESTVPYSAKSGNINNQEMPDDDFSLAENGATTEELSSRDNDGARNSMPNECNAAVSVGQDLNAVCCSSIEPVEDSCFVKGICSSGDHTVGSKLTASCKLDSNDSNIDSEMELDTDDALTAKEAPRLHEGAEWDHDYRSTECSPINLAVPSPCVDQEARTASLIEKAASLVEKADTTDGRIESDHSSTEERRPVLSEEQDTEDRIEFDTNKLSSSEGVSSIGTNNSLHKSRANTISKDHLKNLVPFTEEWLAVMEAFGEEVLEQKSGAVQNSPTDKAAPEPSPWSPVKRKAQDVGPFDCTKYSKIVRASDTP